MPDKNGLSLIMAETNWYIHEEGRGALQTEGEGISYTTLFSSLFLLSFDFICSHWLLKHSTGIDEGLAEMVVKRRIW